MNSLPPEACRWGTRARLPGSRTKRRSYRLAREVIAKQLSVRETEALIRKAGSRPSEKPEPQKDVHTRAAEDRLRFVTGARVRIVRKGEGGRIEIDFRSETELQRIYELLTGGA